LSKLVFYTQKEIYEFYQELNKRYPPKLSPFRVIESILFFIGFALLIIIPIIVVIYTIRMLYFV